LRYILTPPTMKILIERLKQSRYYLNMREEYLRYYRVNLATSYLCNRCESADRDTVMGEIENISHLGTECNRDIVDYYIDILEGKRPSWIYDNYSRLFEEAMEIIIGDRSEVVMHTHERQHAKKIAIGVIADVFNQLYEQPAQER